MRLIDETFLECPFYGARQMVRHFRRLGRAVGRRRVRRLMRKIGLSPIYQAPRTSEAHPAHKTYPYLLRKLLIERPNHVWCADVTYIPMRRGFLYLVAVMDWATRKVLAWRLSNTMEADFCVAALKDAMDVHGRPEIFNTDQGGQFISHAFTGALADAGIRISMDGPGRTGGQASNHRRIWRAETLDPTLQTGGPSQRPALGERISPESAQIRRSSVGEFGWAETSRSLTLSKASALITCFHHDAERSRNGDF